MSAKIPAVEARLPAGLGDAIGEALADAASERVAERLAAGDPTLWAPQGTPEVADRLGWLTIHERMLGRVPEIEAFAAEIAGEDVRDVVLLGMGGSSLAPEVLRRSFPGSSERPRLHVLDSTDAATIASVERAVELEHALFLVSSKSGGTIEPLSLFEHFFALSGRPQRFAAITDPGSGLQRLAEERGLRRVFEGDPDIGGRYSALSPFGIVPAALTGIDVAALLRGAEGAWSTPLHGVAGDGAQQPAAVWLGVALGALARAGRDKLTFLISETLPGLGLWLEQLVAESTGKRGTGILPVAEEPVGVPAQYDADRVFVHLPDVTAPDGELAAAALALADAGHPLLTIPTLGPGDLGRVFLLAEAAVAAAGWALQINPFDQPNVQQAKDATKRVLAGYETDGRLPAPPEADAAQLARLVGDARAPEYVALMAYAQSSPELDDAAAGLRRAIRARTRATTTFGYGPRFLHSTGQFHKGGPPTGRFLQLLHDGPADVSIPGADYSFTTLKEAQAIGDLETLRELGLPAERVRLRGDDAAAALRDLTATIGEQT